MRRFSAVDGAVTFAVVNDAQNPPAALTAAPTDNRQRRRRRQYGQTSADANRGMTDASHSDCADIQIAQLRRQHRIDSITR